MDYSTLYNNIYRIIHYSVFRGHTEDTVEQTNRRQTAVNKGSGGRFWVNKRDTTTPRLYKPFYAGRNAISKLQKSHFMREKVQLHKNCSSLSTKWNRSTKTVLERRLEWSCSIRAMNLTTIFPPVSCWGQCCLLQSHIYSARCCNYHQTLISLRQVLEAFSRQRPGFRPSKPRAQAGLRMCGALADG